MKTNGIKKKQKQMMSTNGKLFDPDNSDNYY